MKQGRRPSIPEPVWSVVFRLYGAGQGYRAIADALLVMGVATTKSSVERLIKGKPPYNGRRVQPDGGERRVRGL